MDAPVHGRHRHRRRRYSFSSPPKQLLAASAERMDEASHKIPQAGLPIWGYDFLSFRFVFVITILTTSNHDCARAEARSSREKIGAQAWGVRWAAHWL